MATPEEILAAWEAFEKARDEKLEKSIDKLDIACDAEQGSP